jgi:KipI family sensor histidine kinase inhibitor
VTPATPAVVPLGEAAWTLVLGETVDPKIHERVTELAARIAAASLPGILEIVPAYAAVTVFFDPDQADADELRQALGSLSRTVPSAPGVERRSGGSEPAAPTLPDSRTIIIPVRYDGPDLDFVAQRTGFDRAEVIRRHSAREYRVYLLGFAPGFAYLGDLDPALVLPRRAEPRTRVPAGSVAIAGAQTAVYPLNTPGGWHLIGTTPLRMFDPARNPAALLHAGDRVRFEPAE